MLKQQLKTWTVVCLLIGTNAMGQANAQSTYPAEPHKPWKERTWQDRVFNGRYEDFTTNKHGGTFFADPFVWSYTQEFADKFRMPQEWVDPGLKGAMAVAWRISTIGQQSCGLGGDAKHCWPVLTCLMDIYFDSNAPLPWRYEEPRRENFMRGISSTDYLPWLSENSPASKYLMGSPKGRPLLNSALIYPETGGYIGGASPGYFDREVEPGLALVGFTGACPFENIVGVAQLKFFSQEEQTRTRGNIKNYAHTVTFSAAYMQKITEIFVANNKPNVDAVNRVLKDFKSKQANHGTPTDK